MLFNSFEFILFFLPCVLLTFFWIGKRHPDGAALFLAVASLFFYGWWNPKFVWLLLASIMGNYIICVIIVNHARHSDRAASRVMAAGIAGNLLLLAFFKYTNFLIDTVNRFLVEPLSTVDIVLPLGISFFTFTQIAYLVDIRYAKPSDRSFVHYLLFVTWFPHLIAGPLLLHQRILPQFRSRSTYSLDPDAIAVGLTFFSLGLCKKVILADSLALYANPIFDAADPSMNLFFATWFGTLAYALELYFDFSGYSDMAVGLSLLFNIRMPINFNSPYRSTNIIDFWRRWNISLSNFLRDYLYIPLGGNRKGRLRTWWNVMVTMLIGGLWHGASWNFVFWGGLHAAYLIINQAWRHLALLPGRIAEHWMVRGLGVLITFFGVVVAWVPFRAANLETTFAMWRSMFGFHGVEPLWRLGFFAPSSFVQQEIWIAIGLFLVWVMPNSPQWIGGEWRTEVGGWHERTLGRMAGWLTWRPDRIMAILVGVLFAMSVLHINKNSPFLYFQF